MAISLVNTQFTYTQTCTAPTNITNDVLVAFVFTWNSGSAPAALTPPSGWTQRLPTGGGQTADLNDNGGSSVWTKVAGGSEPGTYAWTSSNTETGISIESYRSVDTTTPMDVTPAIQANTNNPAPPVPTITTVTAGALVLWGARASGGTAITVPTGTTLRNTTRSSNNDNRVADATQAVAGVTSSNAWSGTGVSSVTSVLALRPAAGAPAGVVGRIVNVTQAVKRAASY